MKQLFISLLFIGLIPTQGHLLPINYLEEDQTNIEFNEMVQDSDPELKQVVFEILKNKCNSCHRKKNPFKIFSLKNMDRQAPKIYKQVFVYRRMPKGNEVKLTEEEYQVLKTWLKTKNQF